MCILCSGNQIVPGQWLGYTPSVPTPLHGQGATSSAGSTGTQNTDGLLSGFRWASTSLTFALAASTASYTDYDAGSEKGSFAPVVGQLATTVRTVMSHISQFTGLTITETSNASLANMRVGRTAQTDTAHAYLPDGSSYGGDIWIGMSNNYDAPMRGDYGWMTVLHEVGHALGLKHSHSYIGGSNQYADDVGVTNLPVTAAFDSLEYTVMSYRSYAVQDLAIFNYYTNENAGYPQSLMMLDIAALHSMYGADFTTNSGNSVYTFSSTTGQMSINGVSEGALAGNRIFRTIWDGGGIDTYDFSNYTSNLQVSLAPGAFSLLSGMQRANLGNGNFAAGNVYNALQYADNAASLIENAIGGSGSDTISGNSVGNTINGGLGNDAIFGGGGMDSLLGSAGNDTIYGGIGISDPADLSDTIDGGEGNDLIYGNGGDDSLLGGLDQDTINGGLGNDAIFGGADADWMTGAADADQFMFQALDTVFDTITDFTTAQGDKLAFTGSVFGSLAAGALDPLRFEQNAAGTASTTDTRFIFSVNTSTLFYDADGSGGGAAVAVVTLTGITNLGASDFLIV
jgi:serralysin